MAIPDPATTNWVPIWNPLSEGPVGPVGPVGPIGPTGASSSVMKYRADTTSTSMASDPGAGKMRWNNVTQNLSTVLSFDRLTDDNFDATLILSLTNSQDEFAIQDQDIATSYQIWRQTGPAVIMGGDWFTIPVVFVSQAGASTFINNQRLAILTKAVGAQGPQGIPGPVGPEGPIGPTGPSGATAAHHTQHETGGTDPIAAISGNIVTSGTVADARLSSNVALKNINNQFTAFQTIQIGNPTIILTDINQPVDSRRYNIANTSGELQIAAVNDASTGGTGLLRFGRSGNMVLTGDIYEKNRLFPMGHWQDVPFNAANFAMNAGGGTWTVGSAAIIKNRYTVIGNTMTWAFYISWFSGSNIVSGTVTGLQMRVPGGFNASGGSIMDVSYAIDGGRIDVDMSTNGPWVIFNRRDGAAFNNGGAPGLIGVYTFELS